MRSRIARHAFFPAALLIGAACGGDGVSPGLRQSRLQILPDSAPTATLHIGDTIRLAARRLGADGTPFPSDPVEFVWSSSNSSVATVDSDGLTRIVGAGAVEITARVAGAATPGVASATDTGRATVTLHGTPLTIRILPRSVTTTEYFPGDTVRLHARRVDAAGVPLPDDTVTFVWESSDTTAMVIDAAVLARFSGVGTATIRARIADENDPAKPSTTDTLSGMIELGRLPVVIHPGPVQAAVAVSWSTSPYCVVLTDGRLTCRNSAGHWEDRGGDLRFTSVSSSSWHACALAVDGRGYCWGRNGHGELGQGYRGGFAVYNGWAPDPLEVTGGHRWLMIEAGGRRRTASTFPTTEQALGLVGQMLSCGHRAPPRPCLTITAASGPGQM